MVDLDARPAPTPFSERTGLLGVRVMEATNICLFRLSKGRVGGTIFGAPVVLLTTSGRKTGVRRTKPLLALENGDSWIVAGSRGGTTHNPDWYENLLAFERRGPVSTAPELAAPEVEYAGDHRVRVTSKVLNGRDREQWWSRLVSAYPKFAAYQQRAPHRKIPVVRLTPTTH
jgi:deazaflavin-dependent oxidoreductase (nitroreductase family)